MELFVQGKVAEILEEQSGEGRNGPWRRRDFILEMDDRFSRKVCVSQWGDSIDNDPVSVGETIKAYINLQSREYNGRWYTDVRAWRIDKGGESGAGGYPDEPGFGDQDTSRQDTSRQDTSRQDTSRSGSRPAQQDPPSKNNSMIDGDLDDVDDDLPF